jgi:hypothetical protein
MLANIGFIVLIGIMGWLNGIVMHHFSSRNKVQVPTWLTFLSGKPSGNVDPVGLSIQILSLVFILWTVFLLLVIPPGEARLLLGQRGCIFLLIASLSLSFIWGRLLKKE